jgi:Prenyltransferase and squalene oxidase repeat
LNKSTEKTPQAGLSASQSRVRLYIDRNIKDGSWPYRPGQEPSTEATAWCTLSLHEKNPHLPAALSYLQKIQNEDGGWSTGPSEGKSDWCSGPALFALRSAAKLLPDTASRSPFERGVNFLAEIPFEMTTFGARVILTALQGAQKMDAAPRGWPWSRDCYHWVEPTSYNLYAFKIPQPSQYKDGSPKLVNRASKYLLENTCSIGGWNHGSHLTLGVNLPPYIVTTAEALLALQDYPTHKEIERAFAFLGANTEASQAGQTKSAMALAWMTLALHAYGRDSKKTLDQLILAQNADGSFGPNMMVTALSAMALNTASGVNPFKMQASNQKTTDADK